MSNSVSNRLLSAINRLEEWLAATRGRIVLMPVRVLGYGLLLMAMVISNIWALLRWPFAAIGRFLVRRPPEDVGTGRVVDVDRIMLEELRERHETVLLDCWAEWCGPCVMMDRAVKDLASDNAGRLKVARLNTLHHPDLARKLGVRGLPTLILFRNRHEVRRHAGALDRSSLQAFVDGEPV